MKHTLFFGIFYSIITLTAHSSEFKYTITADKPECIYNCNEKSTFRIVVKNKNGSTPKKGTIDAILDNFGDKKLLETKFDLASTNIFSVSGTLNEPGFLRLRLSTADSSKTNHWSVGFEPEKIVKGSPRPKDFDSFWKQAVEKFEKEVPADVKLELINERTTDKFNFYRISFATYGRRVYGYLSVPKDKSKGPFRVNFYVNSAGFGNWTNNMQGSDNSINACFSVYPFEMDWRWEKLNLKKKYDMMNKSLKEKYHVAFYAQAGISKSREEYFFYPVILGINRAVDYLAKRDDVDLTKFYYQGTSQGGGFGFYLCGLNKHFTKAIFYVPAITDTMGYLAGRRSGWPRIIENSAPEDRESAEKWAPYFDGANFANRITCPIRVVVGFSDITCPPACVYAAFNQIKSNDKKILHGIGMNHSCQSAFYKDGEKWLSE